MLLASQGFAAEKLRIKALSLSLIYLANPGIADKILDKLSSSCELAKSRFFPSLRNAGAFCEEDVKEIT